MKRRRSRPADALIAENWTLAFGNWPLLFGRAFGIMLADLSHTDPHALAGLVDMFNDAAEQMDLPYRITRDEVDMRQ